MSKGRQVAVERMQHIADAAKAIANYVSRGKNIFDEDSTVRDAILYQIVVIGEAAKAVLAADPTIAIETPKVEWSLWAKMRDRITHQYWATDHEIVWSTAASDVPALRAEIESAILRIRTQ